MSMLIAILVLLGTVIPAFLLHLRHPTLPTAVEPPAQFVGPQQAPTRSESVTNTIVGITPSPLEALLKVAQESGQSLQDSPLQLVLPIPESAGSPSTSVTTETPSESSQTTQSERTTLSSTEVTNPLSTSESRAGVFNDGWYSLAEHMPAHPGRVGGDIHPFAIVVHTTDTIDGKAAIEHSWTTTSGNGACAHFIVGRQGQLTQFISINKNGNHAGGPTHGNWSVAGTRVHPNSVSVGIEVENGGYLGKRKIGGWTHPDTGKILADEDVYIDPRGVGWQRHTPASLATLSLLVDALDQALEVVPTTARLVPDGDYAANQADGFAVVVPPEWLVGHVTLDPVNKTDPGWQGMEWVKARAAKRLSRV